MDEDIERVLACGRRDAAFELLVERYQTRVFRLLFSIVGNAARAEEVARDVFLKVWQALPLFDRRASLATWLYTIARNTALSHIRSESYRMTAPLEEAVAPATSPDARLSRLELDQAIARLPAEQRDAIKLFYLQDRSIEDTATMLDLPVGTVKSHLYRARRALAAIMEVKR